MNISFIHTEPRYSLTHLSRESINSFIYSRQLTYFIHPETFLILFILLIHSFSSTPLPPPLTDTSSTPTLPPLIHYLPTSSTVFPPHPQSLHGNYKLTNSPTIIPTTSKTTPSHPQLIHLIYRPSTSPHPKYPFYSPIFTHLQPSSKSCSPNHSKPRHWALLP